MSIASTYEEHSDHGSSPQRHILTCLPQDAIRVAHASRSALEQREIPGSAEDRYLDDIVPKPWGREIRVYADVFVDAWVLFIKPGKCTSEHAHARKETELLCLYGRGEVTAGDGRTRPIGPGCRVRIAQGAVHRTTAITELGLVEIEAPRDKRDVWDPLESTCRHASLSIL